MVCRESGFNSYATSEVKITRGLQESQTLSLSHELMREGRTCPDPTPEQVTALIDARAEAVRANDTLTDKRKASLLKRLDRARTEPMTGRTFYSAQRLDDRAGKAQVALDDYYDRAARDLGITPEQVKAKMTAAMDKATDGGRDVKAPAGFEDEFTADPQNKHLPMDRQTTVALHQMEQARKDRQSFSPSRPAVTERRPVQSSFMRSMGYDPETGRLEVEINSARSSTGTIPYAYRVPPSVYAKMTSLADARDAGDRKASVGSFYSTQVKGNPDYQYDTAAEADAAATVSQCASCGRFAGSGHSCPPSGTSTAPVVARPTTAAPKSYPDHAYLTPATASDLRKQLTQEVEANMTEAEIASFPFRRSYRTSEQAQAELAALNATHPDGPPATRPAVARRYPVPSSFIRSIGYDKDTERLEVEIANKNGDKTVYAYKTPPSVYAEMTGRADAILEGEDESVGSYFSRNIRNNAAYQYESKEAADAAATVSQCPSCGQFAGDSHSCAPAATPAAAPTDYESRVAQYEAEGATTSDAQGMADADDLIAARKASQGMSATEPVTIGAPQHIPGAGYDARVAAYEGMGETRSGAQAIVAMQDRQAAAAAAKAAYPDHAGLPANSVEMRREMLAHQAGVARSDATIGRFGSKYQGERSRESYQNELDSLNASRPPATATPCGTCGANGGAGHACVPKADPAPPAPTAGTGRAPSGKPASPLSGRGIGMRTYRSDGMASRMPNLTAVQSAARASDSPIMVGVHSTGTDSTGERGTVSGPVMVEHLGRDQGYHVARPAASPADSFRSALRCSCGTNHTTGDCGHVRQVLADTQNRLNSSRISDPKMVAVARHVAEDDLVRSRDAARRSFGARPAATAPSAGYASTV